MLFAFPRWAPNVNVLPASVFLVHVLTRCCSPSFCPSNATPKPTSLFFADILGGRLTEKKVLHITATGHHSDPIETGDAGRANESVIDFSTMSDQICSKLNRFIAEECSASVEVRAMNVDL